MLKIEQLTVGAFAMNCYLVHDSESSQAIFIDPGMEARYLIDSVQKLDVDLKYIINTHAHIDHIAELGLVQKHFNLDFYLHAEELPLLEALEEQAQMFGIPAGPAPKVTKFIQEGEQIELGAYQGRILHTPGHSPGSISIVFEDNVFVGDCLFMDSIGRTDLYKGDQQQLLTSIKEKLLSLPPETKVYSGHGPVTSIGREKMHNPFLTA